MREAVEFARVAPRLWIWHYYDPTVRAELYGTGLAVKSGTFLIDPLDAALSSPWPDDVPAPVGIIITNSNHLRAGKALSKQWKVPIYASRETRLALDLANAIQVTADVEIAPGLSAIAIDGAAPGEIALYADVEGGTVVVGDALINMGSYGFTFLPAKYCSDPKAMRKSLRQLLAQPFERLLFAHGMPIVTNAQARLETLLNENE